MRVHIENIRSFAGKHSLDIKPVTILLGENSSGKTTMLSAIAGALQPDFPTADSFNRSPFELGGYDTIATYRGGKYGRAEHFSIGWDGPVENEKFLISAKFTSHQGIPRVSQIFIESDRSQLTIETGTTTWDLTLKSKREARSKDLSIQIPASEFGVLKLSNLAHLVYRSARADAKNNKRSHERLDLVMDELYKLSFEVASLRPRITALAPLRTRPRRTYDELIEDFKPEGDHVPLVLARILAGQSAKDKSIAAALYDFGKDSGLFDQLKVKRMGNKPSDPFQLRIKSKGPDANLIDVGYGVSQALPIVVDSITAPKNHVVLVQQPEVHLHPRAQASLGTLFSQLGANSGKHFVIETHSDYLVDRVRMAVADKIIPADKVNIAFLDRQGLGAQIHQLDLDEVGNITNAPPSYRKFFLLEETRLLMRGQ